MKLNTCRVVANQRSQSPGDVVEIDSPTCDRMFEAGEAEFVDKAEAKKSPDRLAKARKAEAAALRKQAQGEDDVLYERATNEPNTETADAPPEAPQKKEPPKKATRKKTVTQNAS